MLDKNQPIIVKKIKKGGHGHHGGAWKIAYADFVTAMMAFFLLMWLMAVTTEDQKRAVSEYFQNPTAVTGGPAGANSSIIDMGSAIQLTPGAFGKQQDPSPSRDAGEANSPVPTDAHVERRMEEIEQKRLNNLKEGIEKTIEQSKSLRTYRDQLIIEMTKDGLRITVVDKRNRPMFDLGSSYLKWYMGGILKEIAQLINSVPNKISIAGHTDARKFYSENGYSNWELSADRANASRRQLLAGGMKPEKVLRVEGLASIALFDKEDPYNPVNRRITITVLKKKAEESISKESEAIDYKAAPDYLNTSDGKIKMPPAAQPSQPAQTQPEQSNLGQVERRPAEPPAAPPANEPASPPPAPNFLNLPIITPDMVETPSSN